MKESLYSAINQADKVETLDGEVEQAATAGISTSTLKVNDGDKPSNASITYTE